MGNLIPQVRADKTGKLVTRHVRAEAKTAAGRSRIPTRVQSAPVPQIDPIDQPMELGPFNWGGNGKVMDALRRTYQVDDKQPVEITSREWLEAVREGFADIHIHYFRLAGITDPVEMREFAQQHDRSFLPNIKPGLHRKREEWVDNLIEAGITKEQFDEADKNFGSYGIRTALNDFDRKGSASDTIRMFAEYPNRSSRDALNDFLFDGKMTLDQLKEIGVSRLKKYGEVIKPYVDTVDPGDIASIIKREEKSHSLFSTFVNRKITSRLSAAELWGTDKALELREPGPLLSSGFRLGDELRKMEDNGFEFAKFHDDLIHLSVMSRSQPVDEDRYEADLSVHPEYSHLSAKSFYSPNPEKTLEYFRAGLTVEETLKGLEDGISAFSVRAIKEGATPAVASGWL